jgi:hypothetical protein
MKGLPYSMSRAPALQSSIIKRTIVARDLELTVDGAAGVGFGSVVLAGLPEGNLLLLGATAYMQFTGPTAAGLVDTWEGDYAVGTTPASDATLTAADIDIIGATALAAAVAEASARTRGVSVTATNGTVLDNTDGSLEVNLSLLIDDAHISADGVVMTVNGELHLSYIMLGDD